MQRIVNKRKKSMDRTYSGAKVNDLYRKWNTLGWRSTVDVYNGEFDAESLKKWGLFCTSIEFYDDAFRTREWVLQHNKLYALRFVFGTNMRSEILYCLDNIKEIGIRKLLHSLGYAYGGVYREVELYEKKD
jgi:hypothetical protein